MLQQTQVDRVMPYYRRFLKEFPTVRNLAEAPLPRVLAAWQGLGYNRRAKLLQDAARTIVREYGGRVPRSVTELEKLPGIGPYTARAVAAFAYNEDTVFVETNLRTAVIHHFFTSKSPSIYGRPSRKGNNSTDSSPSIYGRMLGVEDTGWNTERKVSDEEILEILAKALPKGRAREWYAALMDYGAHLKRSGVRINARSVGYAKQKPFKGSSREVRGTLLKELLSGPKTKEQLAKRFDVSRTEQVEAALATLVRDGLILSRARRYALAGEGL
jgi:A/G-specific adenine glycosylase